MKIKKLAIIATILFVFLVGAAHSGASLPEYHKKILDNGATIIATNMQDTPLVTVQIRVLSGLSNEAKYAGSGISHFLEHLLFKGTATRTADQIRSEIKQMGGMVNGSTDLDSAEYYITVPSENFEKALDILSDIVMEPVFSDYDVETEKQVVLEEIRFHNDDPMYKRLTRLFAKAYKENVYKYPVIGEEDRLKELTRKDLIEYHANVYAPGRVVVGISGGIEPELAITVAEKEFGKYIGISEWDNMVLTEPESREAVIAKYPEDITLGYFAIGFHTTGITSPDLYASDVLSLLLGEGEDSRLYKRLVKEKKLLYDVSTMNYTPKYPGLFIITGVGAPDAVDMAREEIFSVIEELKDSEIDPAEIQRARNMILTRYFHSIERAKDMISTQTDLYMLTGSLDFMEKYVEKINRISSYDIKKILDKYIRPGRSTTVLLLPSYYLGEETVELADESGDYTGSAGAADVEKPSAEAPATPADAASLPVTGIATEASTREKEKVVKFRNGLTVIARQNGSVPLVSVVFASGGGLRCETEKNNGLSNLMATLMVTGTYSRKEKEIKPAVEKLGGSLATFSGMNSVGVVMDILSEKYSEGMDIFEDVIKNASFPEEEIDIKRQKILALIGEQEKSVFDNGMIHLMKLMYQDHPYGMRVLGMEESVKSFTRKEIRDFYLRHISPKDSVLTIVGDVDPGKIIKDIESRFKYWKGASSGIGSKKVPRIKQNSRVDIDMNKEQSLILVGYRGVALRDDIKYPLSLMSSLLSGSDGTMFNILREREGLVYTSGAISSPEVDPGYFVFYASTSEENIPKTKNLLFEIINGMSGMSFSDEELLSSKKFLIAENAYSTETNHSLSMIMTLDELYGLGYDDYRKYPERIEKVTRKDMDKCVRAIFDKKDNAVVVVHSSQSAPEY